MAYDECDHCETHYPQGEGLKAGVCEGCYKLWVIRRMEAGLEPPPDPEAP